MAARTSPLRWARAAAPIRPARLAVRQVHSSPIATQYSREDERRRRQDEEQRFIDLLRQGARDQRRAREQRAQFSQGTPFAVLGNAAQKAPGVRELTPRQRQLGLVLLLAGAGGVYYVCHLEQVPETGRWRFMDVRIADENAMGKQTYEKTMATYGDHVLSWSPEAARVQKVAKRIIEVCSQLDAQRAKDAPPTQWNVHVIESPEKNAFALPGGSIFVFTGILPVCENDDGLATVLAHEIAHVLARHPAEKMSGLTVVWALGIVMDMLGFDVGLSRMALNLLMSLPNSRKMETEADHIGLLIMSKACLDPTQAVSFWKRMGAGAKQGGAIAQSAQSILSTHPLDSKRVQHIEEWVCTKPLTQMPSAEHTYDQSGCAQRSAFARAASIVPNAPSTRAAYGS